MNDYALGMLVRERMAEARRSAVERALLRASGARRRPLRIGLGLVLVRIGHWLLGEALGAARAPGRPA